MPKRKTTHTRVYDDTLNFIRRNFPNNSTAEILDISVKTSPIFLEGKLRARKKKR